MTHNPSLYSALKRLHEAEGDLPASTFTARQKKELNLFGQRTRSIKRMTVGRGSNFHITDLIVFNQHWLKLCPSELNASSDSLPSRARNIAGYRDSKLGMTRHDKMSVFLKATANQPVTWYNGKVHLDLNKATQDFGVAALALIAEDTWQSDQPLWLIENQLLFDQTVWFPANEPPATLLYYAGQVPNLLIDWLAASQRTPDLVLFPDYDGVGLLNFSRLYRQLEGRCRFWLMPNWREILTKYGNSKLWCDTRGNFESAQSALSNSLARSYGQGVQEELHELMRAMSSQGLALEQESVWLQGAAK